ncbi:NADH-FMN oxidoreductase RutF, flavin reductase (DIM6/NTAB) family [Clostridium sp. DSM 8431]|uniref:flavin reductase family protein n=1 Tax=Clostridium sp. DSM 8431 TaxID=1761781 RepID=UPI0008E2DD4F|nr:flavin reductase family protein [Clostridium sp. DSM 8431]SFU88640.1 NADH-FMN oxidoreductase RutF, flavin reductase (DIM6/NTAB) family [Clostridium sp. DSM 8431]
MEKLNFKGSVMLNPTPVVLITSKNKEDKVNVFTVGWISTACTRPPILSVAIRPERLSHEYIKESGECVVNLTTRDMVKIVDYCGMKSGRKEDKIKHFGLQLDEGHGVNIPSLTMSPVALECKLRSITPLGSHDMFLLDVVNVKVDENLLDEKGKICFDRANLICYSHGEYYGLNAKPLGDFGYSIRKKKNKATTTAKNNSTAKTNKTSKAAKKRKLRNKKRQ